MRHRVGEPRRPPRLRHNHAFEQGRPTPDHRARHPQRNPPGPGGPGLRARTRHRILRLREEHTINEALAPHVAGVTLPMTANPELVERITTDITATHRKVALGSLRYARNRQPAIVAALPHIAAPIMAINPDIVPTDVHSMRQYGVEPVLVANVDHFPMMKDPDQFNEILSATLESIAGEKTPSVVLGVALVASAEGLREGVDVGEQ